MTEEEKKIKNVQEMFEDIPIKDIESQSITIYGTAILDVIEVLNLIEKQEKEIEVLREENFDTVYMQATADYKSKIKEILKIEGNVDIEFYLKHLVAENNRLEDIEDDRDCNYVSKDKIREKIEELKKEIEEKNENGLDFTLIHEHEIDINGIIEVLNELLEE